MQGSRHFPYKNKDVERQRENIYRNNIDIVIISDFVINISMNFRMETFGKSLNFARCLLVKFVYKKFFVLIFFFL